MKPMIKQLAIATFILTLVTVLSFGIRQVRFSLHRAKTIESPVIADPEPAPYPADSRTVDAESEPQYADASGWDVDDEPDLQPVSASDSDEEAPSEDHPEPKVFKAKYAKSKGSKGLERLSLGDDENLYRTAEGQLWYVSKLPNGKTVKMQVQIDDVTGEMTLVDAKSGGSKGLEKVTLSDYENLYITEEGQQWYVSKQPDGSVSKSQVQIDDTTGEVTILSSEDYAKSDDGQESTTKD